MNFIDILIQISKILAITIFIPFTFYNICIPYDATKIEKRFLFCACLGIGIPFVSFVFLLFTRILNEQSFYTLFSITTLPFFFYSLFYLKKLKLFIVNNYTLPLKYNLKNIFVLFFVVVLLLFLILSCVFFPVIENDSIEYFHISRLILGKSFIYDYPSKDAIKGFVLPLTHPLGFPSYLAFGAVLLDVDIQNLNSKFFVIMVPIIISFILIKISTYQKHIKNPFIATFLVLSFPFFFLMSFGFHIDPIRCLTFFSASLFAYLTIKRDNYSNYILLGLSIGLSWFVHSSGILTLFILFTIVFIKNRKKLIKTITYICVSFLVCLSVVILDFIKIYDVLGSIFGDLYTMDIAKENKEAFTHFRKLDRDVSSFSEKFFYGFGKMFFEYRNFGFFYLITIPACIIYIKRKINTIFKINTFLDFSILIVFMFYLGVLFASFIGIDIFLHNHRYMLQPILHMALIGSLFTEKVFSRYGIIRFRKT
ncbi:MAG: glycosyltransferase family 39 protein [Alphaproteobacteria bacterium]|nr:glycosyltransferase family 39 protein [Alphaproteobacteria bacterium]